MSTTGAGLDELRARLRSWLDEHTPLGWRVRAAESDAAFVQVQREWMATLDTGGWAVPKWPVEHGGLGATVAEQVVIAEELQRADAPPLKVFDISLNHTGATLIHHGTEAQLAHLPRIRSGKAIWCQGFSEPDAGSDLASLATRAVRDGDHYIVSGQKVWSSWGHHADWCLLLVRTNPEAPKHQGISYLLVDLTSPGVEVRPLVQMTGNAEFSEIFLDEVSVPVENLIGREGDGWAISQTTLKTERGAFLLRRSRALDDRFAEIVHAVRGQGLLERPDSAVAHELAGDYGQIKILVELCRRIVGQEASFGSAGWNPSIAKLFEAELAQRVGRHALSALGLGAQRDVGVPGALLTEQPPWVLDHLETFGLKIAGGTAEIQRNILGEKVLGLPREPAAPEARRP
ncbi:MAG TPA: acyl-CoA dehydrogenase family protein [Ilumatobacter sp.]|nr:acyl-CoA dehydrogenase family protein [Ilumatobacter sp.]